MTLISEMEKPARNKARQQVACLCPLCLKFIRESRVIRGSLG
jgi:hypothetical protein